MDNQQKRPIAIDLSWLAGMWEADGSFSLNKNKNQTKYIQYEPHLQFVNTDLMIIEEVIRILKELQIGYYFMSRIQPIEFGKKLKYEIRVQGMKRCGRLLKYLLEYIRGQKKKRAEFIKTFIDLRLSKPKNQRYGDEEHSLYKQYEDYNNRLLEFSTTNMLNTYSNETRVSEDRA